MRTVTDNNDPPRFLILGAGRFGRIAFDRLRKRWPLSRIIMVDCRRPADLNLDGVGVRFISAEAVDYLVALDEPAVAADWIVPAVPVHVAGQWVRRRLAESGQGTTLAIPSAVVSLVPHPMQGEDDQLYVSNADFLCPDDCPEPEKICTVTGKPRPQVLYTFLAGLSIPGFTMVVVRSRQLAPGVGGYQPVDLQNALDRVRAAPGPVLLATACKCHGVIEALDARSVIR